MSKMHARASALLPCLVLTIASAVSAEEPCNAHSGAQVMPLVELYTSEGCSSCPPADRWLSRQRPRGDANFLAFHVDYWDDIGWPDRFASPRYSQRQRERVGGAGQRTVYTPQVMVGDEVQANWHNDSAWQQTLREASRAAGAELSIRIEPAAKGWLASIEATTIGPPTRGAQLWLARTRDGQTSAVRAGENRGQTLHHDRIVSQLSGPWILPATGTLIRQVELSEEATAWGVTAFVQDERGSVLQSVRLDAERCGRN